MAVIILSHQILKSSKHFGCLAVINTSNLLKTNIFFKNRNCTFNFNNYIVKIVGSSLYRPDIGKTDLKASSRKPIFCYVYLHPTRTSPEICFVTGSSVRVRTTSQAWCVSYKLSRSSLTRNSRQLL